jgi:uncharacterized protein YhbP (UPF0306 family)
MNQDIKEFIIKQKCANIACVNTEGVPYCFSCFYAFNSEEGCLYFKSSVDTYHIKLITEHPLIAGTILPDKLPVISMKGVQFQGEVLRPDHPLSKSSAKKYYSINPLAIAVPGEIWTVLIHHIKMTDSSKGFGKKTEWTRTEMPVH